jgi:mannose-6-phosphate isomerase-like protein (cupin superfamily)
MRHALLSMSERCRYARGVSYTIKNLREVEDSAPKFGFDSVQEAHFAHADLEAQDTGFSFHVVKPGCRQGFAHRHEAAEEVYVVVSGSGRIKLDDEVAEIKQLDAIRVAPQVARAFEADADGLELIAFGPRHAGDGEILKEDFWG